MTTTTDLAADVLDYLLAQCQASPALQALGVQVFDGPQPAGTISGVEQCLWIGHNPQQVNEEAAHMTQGFSFLSSNYRDESGEITCAAKHWTGDVAMKPHRDGCKQIIAAVELLLRGSPATGGPGDGSMAGLVQWSEFTEVTWWQQLASGGAEAYCVFKITYFARLPS